MFNCMFFGVHFFYCVGGTYKYLIIVFVFLESNKEYYNNVFLSVRVVVCVN